MELNVLEYGLPPADNGVVSTCIPFNLNLSEFLVGQSLSLQIDIVGSGKDREHIIDQIIEQRCRVQIVVPVEDLNPTEPNLPDWVPLFGYSDISIHRKSWKEGRDAEVVLKKNGDTEEVQVFFLVVYNSEKINHSQFVLKVKSTLIKENYGERKTLERTQISFDDNDGLTYFTGCDGKLMSIFEEHGGFNLDCKGSVFHPKQIHSTHSVSSYLTSLEENKPLNITYVGPDTCENLHSVLRTVNTLSKLGRKIDTFTIIHKPWDYKHMDRVKILRQEYFQNNDLSFDVKLVDAESKNDVKSDLIITTYVTSWAYDSAMKGSAVDQYLGNIIKRIKDSDTLIISVDPTDVHRVTRSFNSLVHLGRPSDVFRLAGLILQDDAPGGYGTSILDKDGEICWVTSYKTIEPMKSKEAKLNPQPNDVCSAFELVYPAGRKAYIQRLIKPHLRKANLSSYSKQKAIEGFNWDATPLLSSESLNQNQDRISFVVGGPGAGKSVFLQQQIWEKRLFEDEISVSIPARDLAKKEYLHALNLKNSAEQIITLLDIIEEITTKNHKEIYWSGNLRKWLEKGLKLNLYIDALDEVRGESERINVLSILLSLSVHVEFDVRLVISMRENILSNVARIIEINKVGEKAEMPVYKLEWDESRIVREFIPSLLHGWNINIDSASEKELEIFIRKSKRSLANKVTKESRNLFNTPLRAVWLVNFVYDQSVNLQEMNLSEFEIQILRLSIKNRFESRRLEGKELPGENLDELLDIVSSIAVLDYDWAGKQINFDTTKRQEIINCVKNSPSISPFLRVQPEDELELFFFEDMSLLYVTGDDTLAWIHENLREHAIALGLIKFENSSSICRNMIDNLDYSPPTLRQILFDFQDYCSLELSDAVRRLIPTDVLIDLSNQWLAEWKESRKPGHEIINLDNLDDLDGSDFNTIVRILSSFEHLSEFLENIVKLQDEKTAEYKTKRDELNLEIRRLRSESEAAANNREKFNRLVSELKSKRNEINGEIQNLKRQRKNTGSVNHDQKFEQLVQSQKDWHQRVQDAASQAQTSHEVMQSLETRANKLEQEANEQHKKMKASSVNSNNIYPTYAMLKHRFIREFERRKSQISMENKSALVVDEVDESKDIMEIEQIVSSFYTTEELGVAKANKYSNELIDIIDISSQKDSIKIAIHSVYKSALIGEKGSRVKRLRKFLENQFSIKFTIDFHPSYISKSSLENFFEHTIPVTYQEESGDFEFDIIEYSFEPLIGKNRPDGYENRLITITTSDVTSLKRSGFDRKLLEKLRLFCDSPIKLRFKEIDLDSGDVKSSIFKYIEEEGIILPDFEIFVRPFQSTTKGRHIIISSSEIEEFKSLAGDLKHVLEEMYGGFFMVTIDGHSEELNHLDESEITLATKNMIDEIMMGDNKFILQSIEVRDLYEVRGRKVIVYSNSASKLIGKKGSVHQRMTKELERIYGSPVQLHMFSLTPDEQELIRATETLIHELRNLPENFELISIIPSDYYDKSARVYLKNRTIRLRTSHNHIVSGRMGATRKGICRELKRLFGGNFFLKFDNSHARNLNSITVEDFLRSKIEGYAEDWGLPSDFDIYSIIINELDGISGRKIGIYSSQNSRLIGKKGKRVKQLTHDLEEKFGSPIKLHFIGDMPSLNRDEVDSEVRRILDILSIKPVTIEYSQIDGSENRLALIQVTEIVGSIDEIEMNVVTPLREKYGFFKVIFEYLSKN